MIGNLLQQAGLTKRQKTALRKLRRERFLETGVYEAAGIRARSSHYTRPMIMIDAIDAAARDHLPPRVRPDEQIRHAAPSPLWDAEIRRVEGVEQRRDRRV